MKRTLPYFISLLIMMFSLALQAQNDTSTPEKHTDLTYFLNTSDEKLSPTQTHQLKQKVVEFMRVQHKKQMTFHSTHRFLKQLNRKIHTQFLKNYKKFSSFSEMLQTGDFDCLSGVILYALILDELGYEYTVYQTNIHVYLMIQTEKRTILIETTDPIYGFVDSDYYIKQRKKAYEKTVQNIGNQGIFYVPTQLLHQKTSIKELGALQYYNQAVKHYNQRNLERASSFLGQAEKIYTSNRTQELRKLIDFHTSQASVN